MNSYKWISDGPQNATIVFKMHQYMNLRQWCWVIDCIHFIRISKKTFPQLQIYLVNFKYFNWKGPSKFLGTCKDASSLEKNESVSLLKVDIVNAALCTHWPDRLIFP